MKICVVCGNQMPEDAAVCSRCGFSAEQRRFLSERHYRAWIQETVEPARLSWQRQELERQRRELEEQRESAEKNKSPKKTGGFVKNALIAVVVFVLAGAVGKNLIAPNLASSASSDTGTNTSVSALDTGMASSDPDTSSDSTAEQVELSQEQLNKAAEVGFDLNLFENLPLTSREDILAWLEQNGYEYEEYGEESDWNAHIMVHGEKLISVSYKADGAGSKESYLLSYDYNSDYSSDYNRQSVVAELMGELHQKKDDDTYFDGVTHYYISEYCARRRTYMISDQTEIDDQADMLLSVLNEIPDILDEQATLDWIAGYGMTYDPNDEFKWCDMDLGIWRCTYFYSDYWRFETSTGNPKDYYDTTKEKLADAGFEAGEEIEGENGTYTYSTQSGTVRIWMQSDQCYHDVHLYVNPVNS